MNQKRNKGNQRSFPESSVLDGFPRIGWAEEATPVTELPGIARTFNARWIGCKRDDLCPGLYGGTKVRKLDFLLAGSPFREARSWATMGAIGSGHIVACCAAAKELGRKIDSHLFWEPISEGIIENLAFTTSASDAIQFYRSRMAMALRRPALFLSSSINGSAIIPVGTTCPRGILGTVRAGLELAGQVHSGELPEPERIYVALGSGGTVAGLAIGTALGGLTSTIHAVTTVERVISTGFRLRKLISDTRKLLINGGHGEVADTAPAKVIIDRSQLGKGYGFPTRASLEAVKLMREEGIMIEPVYTGKTAAAMLNDLGRRQVGPVLFWNSMRRELPGMITFRKNKLPARLQSRLNEQ